ncbi:MAG: hypothetical protein N3A69_16780, partial [Leptospiraceae bacterium]|nr:hypothetical protein [Leptospiraceae bacterium]
CYSFLLSKEELQNYQNASKRAFLKFYHLESYSFSFRKAFQFLIEQGFSIRIRYARNLRNFPFQVPSVLMDKFFEKTQKIFSNYFSFQAYHWKYANSGLYLDLFDEDHFRLYFYPHSFKELIEFFKLMRNLDSKDYFAFHEEYKYLTACPTNSYFGNKISIQLELKQVIQANILKSEWFILDKKSIDPTRKQEVTFFLKNFNSLDLKRFLQFWENFIKSKTSNYK